MGVMQPDPHGGEMTPPGERFILMKIARGGI